jgi:hypothetical protein
MPVPNFASILSNIGGVTSWSVWSSDGVGPPANNSNLTLPRVLGDGTFLVMNQLMEQDINGYVVIATPSLYEMNIRQGVGFTYPSGSVNISQYNGTTITRKWSDYINQNTNYFHQGWAIKLSGVTSGGASGLGGSGLGGL